MGPISKTVEIESYSVPELRNNAGQPEGEARGINFGDDLEFGGEEGVEKDAELGRVITRGDDPASWRGDVQSRGSALSSIEMRPMSEEGGRRL